MYWMKEEKTEKGEMGEKDRNKGSVSGSEQMKVPPGSSSGVWADYGVTRRLQSVEMCMCVVCSQHKTQWRCKLCNAFNIQKRRPKTDEYLSTVEVTYDLYAGSILYGSV